VTVSIVATVPIKATDRSILRVMTIPRASLDSVRLAKFVSSWRAPHRGHFDAYLMGIMLALTNSIVSDRRFPPPWSVRGIGRLLCREGSRLAREIFFAVQANFVNRRFANPGELLDLVLRHKKQPFRSVHGLG